MRELDKLTVIASTKTEREIERERERELVINSPYILGGKKVEKKYILASLYVFVKINAGAFITSVYIPHDDKEKLLYLFGDQLPS